MPSRDLAVPPDAAAFQFMIMDMLENILQYSDHPGHLGTYLTKQIRELVGGRIVALLQCPPLSEDGVHRLVSIAPERYNAWDKAQELETLARISHDVDRCTLWNAAEAPAEVQILLAGMECNAAIALPLRIGSTRVGVLLVLHLLDMQRPAEILRALDLLSPVVALILRNALLYESQEAEIQARTSELAGSEDRLRTLINAMPDIVCFKDGNGRWLEANDFDLRLFQLDGVDYRGKKDSELAKFSPFYREAFLTCEGSDEQAWNKGDISRGEETIPRPDGQALVFDIIKVPTFDIDSRRKGLIVVGRDITERKRSEEALQESEKRFRAIFEQAAVGVALIETETWRFTRINPKYCDILGYALEEMSNRTFQEIIHPEDLSDCSLNMQRLTAGELRDFSIEQRYRHKDGSHVWVNLTVSSMWEEGDRPDYYIAVVEDITMQKRAEAEREKLEKQLRQAQKMEAIGTLAGGIAHDFNNILGSIFGYTQLALDDAKSGIANRDFLEEIFKAAVRARDLVKQILTLSRQSDLEKKPFDISLIIKESIKLFRASLPANILIEQEISAKESIISGDPTQIHQVLINLATNAAHAMMENGGVLGIRLSDFCLDVDSAAGDVKLTPGPYLKLSVSDTGHGIESNVIDKIFDPFFTTKETGKGTGMGLAIVHGIVKKHGGAISAYSEPGKGSTFNIILPMAKKTIEPEANLVEDIPRGSETVLLVDDEPGLLDAGKKMLTRLGYKVVAKAGSLEALAAFVRQPDGFDLVVTDMAMPTMTGDKLAKELIRLRPDIPVILCTGFSEVTSEEKAKEIGVKGFLMKPIDLNRLAKLIREVLG
ncbi:MAG: PAS domain S-box protein [Deltaproteobacteria bacterium]|nr:PAS domain S-box protein [Deltaproteobacteria bacterium]